ncbi:Scr1 family TA system antitoxin-like transcriptional regulator [Micromonospora sp. CPCC 205539]|uniref:DUF5753 domain-containing protein n=1 Tax=Micromonospora sp. CPCC 205539 TaxID=3122408 RepID=UPI002FF15818
MNHAFVAALADAGHTAESLADRLGVHPKTVARWANPGHIPQGRHRTTAADLLARDVDELWPDVVRRREPVWFRPWVDIEREAVTLRTFELAWVPGLLQTEAYARATLGMESLTAEEVEERAVARVQRQAILHRPRPPLLVAVMDESVLRRRVGRYTGLMREQCEHIAACAELPHVQVHVVPVDTPMYLGLGGPYTLAEVPDGTHVAHEDSQVRARIIDDTTEIATLGRRWARIVGEALPRAQSLDLIREAAASWT